MPREVTNIGASVRSRLRQVANRSRQPVDFVLTRYANERMLYRLSQSPHAERFVLKGAMLLTTWIEQPFRPTRDLDLLGFGDPEPQTLLDVFEEVAGIECEDGVRFHTGGARATRIREHNEYGGLRIRMVAEIDQARVPISIDIGFGDATVPDVQEIDYPVLLDMPAPRLRGYAPETVVAEKFQAMVAFGLANSRMKDYFDV